MQSDLIDEYWLNVNPVLLGNGIPFFKDIQQRTNLKLVNEKKYDGGVVALHYVRQTK